MPGKCVHGNVVLVNLDPTVGHEIQKTRPCVVIQNDIGNAHSPLVIVAAIEGAENVKRQYPINVVLAAGEGGLAKASVVLCNQIRTVDEIRLVKILGKLGPPSMARVDQALKISLSL